MKKRLTVLVVMVIMLVALTACGSKNDNAGSSAAPSGNEGSSNTASAAEGASNSGTNANNVADEDNPFAQSGSTNDVISDMEQKQLAAKIANPIWDGVYYSTDTYWDGVLGVIEVSINDDGTLNVECNINGKQATYTMTQDDFDERALNPDSSGMQIASAVYKHSNGSETQIQLKNYGYGRVCVDFCPADDYDLCASGYPKAVTGDDKYQAPEGYEDRDNYGLITESLSDNSGFFTPMSDYYIVYCKDSSRYSYKNNDWTQETKYETQEYELYDFDINHVCISCRYKVVFDSAETASKYYDYLNSQPHNDTEYHLDGKAIYYSDSYGLMSSITVCTEMNFALYYDCHYAYKYDFNENVDDSRHEYYYLSQPLTKHDYLEHNDLSRENAAIFASWKGGNYPCLKEGCNRSMWYNGFIGDGIPLDVFGGFDALKLYSDHAIVADYGQYLYEDEAEDIYEYIDAKIFTVVKFTKTTLEMTEYVYKVEDRNYADNSVTFDNFETAGATYIVTHRYDMTKPIENN